MKATLLKSYVMIVMLTAAAVAAWTGRTFPMTEIGGWLAVLMWTFAVGPQTIAFPRHRVQITAADCFLFYCLVAHGPLGAMTAAFVGTLGAHELGERRPSPQQGMFNLSSIPLSAGAAGYVFHALSGDAGLWLPLMAAAAVFAVTNTLLVTLALAIEGKTRVVQSLTGPGLGFIVSVFVTAAAGGALAELSRRGPGDWAVAGVVAVCFLVGTILSMARDLGEARPTGDAA
jgi:hypothetical protein